MAEYLDRDGLKAVLTAIKDKIGQPVTTDKISDSAVTTGKIQDGAVTEGKLDNSTQGKLADNLIVKVTGIEQVNENNGTVSRGTASVTSEDIYNYLKDHKNENILYEFDAQDLLGVTVYSKDVSVVFDHAYNMYLITGKVLFNFATVDSENNTVYENNRDSIFYFFQTGTEVSITAERMFIPDSVTTEHLKALAVTSDKIQSGAVTYITLDTSLRDAYMNFINNFACARGAADGIATLDSNGKVPEEQLPSYVDDVIEGYLNDGKFYEEEAHATELTGETGKIYVNLTDNQCYRYTGSQYVTVSDVPAETLKKIDSLETATKDNKIIIGTLNKASDGTYSITIPAGLTNTEVLKAIQSNHAYIQYGTTSSKTRLYHLGSYDNGSSYIYVWENTDTESKVMSSFEMQYNKTNDKFSVLNYKESSLASSEDVTTVQNNLTTLQNTVNSDNTALGDRVTALENNGTIVMTLTSYPSGTLSLPAGVTVSDARGKMREGKAVVCYLNNDANVSIYYRFNSKVGNNYYFEAVSQYDIKSNRLTGVSMGCATVLEQNGSLVCKLDSLGLATSDSVADAAEKMVSITWSDLKDKRDAGTLTTGQQYRITDYTCTTTQADTQSAGHQFDIIVTADSTSKLNEQAKAILHDGDTYFASSKLEAWKLWYSLDNDTTRFAWADSTNGKGVVYRMIDEWNNDVPYDFKNIQFDASTILEKDSISISSRFKALMTEHSVGGFVYTFSIKAGTEDSQTLVDYSLTAVNNNTITTNSGYSFRDATHYNYLPVNIFYSENPFERSNSWNIVKESTNNLFIDVDGITVGNGCWGNSFFGVQDVTLGNQCWCNSIEGDRSTNGHITLQNFDGYNIIKNCTYLLLEPYVYYSNISTFDSSVFETGVRNLTATGTNTGTEYVRNYRFAGSATGAFTAEVNRDYITRVACNSNGILVEYCEADLIMIPLTGVEVDGEDTLSATGTYTYKIKPTPANATDIKSIVWSSDANATYGSIDANTGVATVKQLPPVNAAFTITATVTTNSGQTFTAIKNVTINKAS